jgi:hypothetical protein
MPKWKRLNPLEQNELLGEITKIMVGALPTGWRRMMLYYHVIGDTHTFSAGVFDAEGRTQDWNPPGDVWPLLADLRSGMYADDLGTWYSIRLTIDHPDTFKADYNWTNEPDFQGDNPSPEDYTLDQKRFPRSPENMLPWFRQKLPAEG